jgi:hypothetical protein
MIRTQIGTIHPEDAFEALTTGDCVTGHRIIVDGDQDMEVVVLDSHAGASSVAPSVSGIPSAVTQNGDRNPATTKPGPYTPMAGRLQKQVQNVMP